MQPLDAIHALRDHAVMPAFRDIQQALEAKHYRVRWIDGRRFGDPAIDALLDRMHAATDRIVGWSVVVEGGGPPFVMSIELTIAGTEVFAAPSVAYEMADGKLHRFDRPFEAKRDRMSVRDVTKLVIENFVLEAFTAYRTTTAGG